MSLRSAGGHPSAAPDTITATKVRGNRGASSSLHRDGRDCSSRSSDCCQHSRAVRRRRSLSMCGSTMIGDIPGLGGSGAVRRSPGQARGFTTSVRHRRGIRPGAVSTYTPRAPLRRRDHIEVLSPDLVELPSTVIHNPAADLAFRDEPASKTAGIEITDRHLLASDHCRKLVETIRLPRVAPHLRVQVDRSPHPTARRRSGDTDQVRRHLGWNVFPPLYVFAHLPPSTDPVISVDDLATRSQIGQSQPGCRSLARAEVGEVRRADVHATAPPASARSRGVSAGSNRLLLRLSGRPSGPNCGPLSNRRLSRPVSHRVEIRWKEPSSVAAFSPGALPAGLPQKADEPADGPVRNGQKINYGIDRGQQSARIKTMSVAPYLNLDSHSSPSRMQRR